MAGATRGPPLADPSTMIPPPPKMAPEIPPAPAKDDLLVSAPVPLPEKPGSVVPASGIAVPEAGTFTGGPAPERARAVSGNPVVPAVATEAIPESNLDSVRRVQRRAAEQFAKMEGYESKLTRRETVGNRPMPEVRLVDMREEFRRVGEVTPLSAPLVEALTSCLARGEQALILRNRRGWAAAILCPACGQRLTCRLCSLALTWHKKDRRLRCHACGGQHPLPTSCPACGGTELRELGEGTERIEEEIAKVAPSARIVRMDRDTVSSRGAHERILRSFDAGDADVLVGTQMIAKGHDFPRVTLVGVLAADHALGLPDFRAGERAFQLLTQVAGRAGRGDRLGRVIAQAFDPGHPVLLHAAKQDYEAFFDAELRYRRALRYPPLAALVQIIVAEAREPQAWRIANDVAAALTAASAGRLTITGPGPAPIERLRGLYRMQILVRSAGRRRLVETVSEALHPFEATSARRAIHVDVDPVSLL